MVTNGSEHIHDFTIMDFGMVHPVGCQDGQLQDPSNAYRCLVTVFLTALEVTLQLHVHISTAKQIYKSFYFAQSFIESAMRECGCQRAFIATCETDQTFGVPLHFGQCRGTFGLGAFPQLVSSNQATEILVARDRFCQ